MRDRLVLVTALLVATAALGGFAAPAAAQPDATYETCEFPVTMTDATGEEITLEEPPERVTTTNPSAAQTMWEIGGESQVVGVTQYAMYLDGADEKTDVSAERGVDVEKVAGTEPDLVLAPNASAGQVQALRDAGLTVYHFPEAKTTDDIAQKTTTIGKLTGNCEGAAETNAWMNANVDAVSNVTADADRPRVLYPLGSGFVAGGDTFINATFTLAGTNNTAATVADGYPQISDEVVLELDPEWIVVNSRGDSALDEEPYASTTAGEEGNAVYLEVHWLNQPAPASVVNTIHDMTRQVHGDVYDNSTYVERSEISVEAEDEADSDTEEPTETTEVPATTEAPETTGDGTSGDSAPGFGAVVTLVAVLGSALAAARVRQ
ncbi:PGF-CTERM-anchored ABC transporter substrate-binding protein [Haloparvum sedimenti]|uniref:PGF-CTERM-anchored ABC transporter substrate-binding protein n=1 Tax=Haloparvum sedimenti TaxID=1678448 RepID=UPI00071E886D|nr:PGF-CTERM-anchored ABC transporter substrate-binding protein [Haloparvum sedimenti]